MARWGRDIWHGYVPRPCEHATCAGGAARSRGDAPEQRGHRRSALPALRRPSAGRGVPGDGRGSPDSAAHPRVLALRRRMGDEPNDLRVVRRDVGCENADSLGRGPLPAHSDRRVRDVPALPHHGRSTQGLARRPGRRRACGAAARFGRRRARLHQDRAQSDGVLAVAAFQEKPMGFFTDTSICIGCKACEVACKEWNQLQGDPAKLTADSYDNTGQLDAQNWRHVQFIEQVPDNNGVVFNPTPIAGGQAWLMMSDVCKHCKNASCMEVCPTGALMRTEFDTVYLQKDVCNGCRDCISACPYGVIGFNEQEGVAQKCTL